MYRTKQEFFHPALRNYIYIDSSIFIGIILQIPERIHNTTTHAKTMQDDTAFNVVIKSTKKGEEAVPAVIFADYIKAVQTIAYTAGDYLLKNPYRSGGDFPKKVKDNCFIILCFHFVTVLFAAQQLHNLRRRRWLNTLLAYTTLPNNATLTLRHSRGMDYVGLCAFAYAVQNNLNTNTLFHSYRKASTGCMRVARKAG